MLTTSERRGLALLLLVFALGAARDLWTWYRLGRDAPGPAAPPPAEAPAAGAAASAAGTDRGADAPPVETGPLDLNRATAEELDRLPGIGPVLAGRILEHRRRHGPFRSPDELLAVPGIGPRVWERLSPRVRAGPPADSATSAPAPGAR